MSTDELEKSKSEPTLSTEPIADKEQKEQSQPLKNGALRFIKSPDLRLLPAEVFARSTNPDLNAERFYKVAAVYAGPLMFALYGLDDTHKIQEAVLCFYDMFDEHVYVDNVFGCDLTLEPLQEALEREVAYYEAKGLKLLKSEPLELRR